MEDMTLPVEQMLASR